MCTLALAWRVFPSVPVALVANRDESVDRPSEPPTVRGSDPAVVAPRDRRAGGTWIGVSERGLVVAITNRWIDADRKPTRSRGLLVDDCLGEDSAQVAATTVEREVEEHVYDGFNLVIADGADAFLVEYDGECRTTRMDPGVHVVGNVGGVVNGRERFSIPEHRDEHGAARVDSARRVATATEPGRGETARAWLERVGAILADHENGACLHGDGFGTRSSTIIRTGSKPAVRFADGPPCVTPGEPVSLPADFGSGSDPSSDPSGENVAARDDVESQF